MRDVFFSDRRTDTRARTGQQVRAALSDAYSAQVGSLSGGETTYRHTVTSDTSLAVGRVEFTGQMTVESEPLPFLCIVQLYAGQQTVDAGAQRFVRSDATPFLFPRHSRKTVNWSGTALHQVVLRPSDVDVSLNQMGRPGLAATLMHSDPVSAEQGGVWASAARHARAVMGLPAFQISPLMRATTLQLLATAVVDTFGRDSPQEHDTGGGHFSGSRPRVVRVALEFIDQYAHEPITTVQIAEAAGVSVRGVQAAFAKYHKSTPTQAIHQARIRGAHRDLLAATAENPVTVTHVAAKWGFTHAGRFAAEYRLIYGHNPAVTLDRC